jgi:predicted DNA-binding transcriptional regulator AlpA
VHQTVQTEVKTQLTDDLAAALDRLAEQHAQAAIKSRSEYIRRAEMRREYLGDCSRAQGYLIERRPDFPKPIELGPKLALFRRSEIEEWLARQRAGGAR